MLVEDDSTVRKMVRKVLTRYGFEVIEAGTPLEALELASENEALRIDLLLTDVVMPGYSGPELAEQLREKRPGLKVAFMSGYTEHASLHSGIISETSIFIQKPFTPDSLAKKIKAVLDGVNG